jgi:hypothetical protein
MFTTNNSFTNLSDEARAKISKLGTVTINPHKMGVGYQGNFNAPNGWRISFIKFPGSYGSKNDLWEAAILDKEGKLCYTTDLTNDVIGYLDEDSLFQLCVILTYLIDENGKLTHLLK